MAGAGLLLAVVNPYTKLALSALRLAALALVLVSFFLCASDLYLYLSKRLVPRRGLLVVKSIPFFLGVVLAARSRPLAQYLTRDLE